MSDNRLRYDVFSPLVGKPFRIEFTDGVIDLTLEDVTALPAPRRASRTGGDPEPASDLEIRQQPFTMTFLGPGNVVLPQRIYPMQQDAFSEPVEIFIVPIGRDASGVRYQAVFT